MIDKSNDPRKNIKKFTVDSSAADKDNNVTRIIFNDEADLVDARYELVHCNNAILIDDGDDIVLIEPIRIQNNIDSITMMAKR